MRKTMGFFLIIIGVLMVACGITMVTRHNESKREEFRSLTPIPKSQLTIPTTSSTQNETNATTPPVHNNTPHDTVVVERVVERVVEKEIPKDTKKPDTVSDSKSKGNDFEDFVVNLLADWRFKLLDRTQDHKSSAGVVAESSKNPDLHVQQKRGKSNIDYYIECKYRSRWTDGAVTFDDWQVSRYRKFQGSVRRKVIIALGVGGTPSQPSTLRLVPLDSVKGNTIREIDTKYAIEAAPSALAEYVDDYFTDVFKKSSERKSRGE